jgi:GTP cyclohydrolase I
MGDAEMHIRNSLVWSDVEVCLEELVQSLHDNLGWFSEEEVNNTPGRVTRFYREMVEGNDFTFTIFEKHTDQLVLLKDISFFSLCSHHLLPFYGKVHIGYLPKNHVCGVSKLARVVKKIAGRPQIQEQMTEQIADFIMEKLDPEGVMVIVHGAHTCMIGRGVKEPNSIMVTSAIRGKFKENPELKEEMMRLL